MTDNFKAGSNVPQKKAVKTDPKIDLKKQIEKYKEENRKTAERITQLKAENAKLREEAERLTDHSRKLFILVEDDRGPFANDSKMWDLCPPPFTHPEIAPLREKAA